MFLAAIGGTVIVTVIAFLVYATTGTTREK